MPVQHPEIMHEIAARLKTKVRHSFGRKASFPLKTKVDCLVVGARRSTADRRLGNNQPELNDRVNHGSPSVLPYVIQLSDK